jgi:hypothetical protein
MPEGGEFAWRGGSIYHSDFNGFIKVGNHWVRQDPRHIGVSTMKFHIMPDKHYLGGVLLPWVREHIYLQVKTKHEFTLSQRDELIPNRVYPGIVGGVILKVKYSLQLFCLYSLLMFNDVS